MRRPVGLAQLVPQHKFELACAHVCAQLLVRQDLLTALQSDALMEAYGIQLDLSAELSAELVSDPMGDRLDAVLCAIQAAWAYQQRAHNYAIPAGHEIEGWIIDPGN